MNYMSDLVGPSVYVNSPLEAGPITALTEINNVDF